MATATATALFPFERVVRSVDGGASWTLFALPRFEGEMAYSSGQVETGNGRLVALLDRLSDDRPHHPSERHRGLWASNGSDWSIYSPLTSRMSPPRKGHRSAGPRSSRSASPPPRTPWSG